MTQKDKMLKLVLSDSKLQELYDYRIEDYEDIYDALRSDNPIVTSVAKIIKELDGSNEPSEFKRVYKTIFTYLNSNLLI